MNFKFKPTFIFILLFSFFFYAEASSRLNIVTTSTDLAWLVREIGGVHVEVNSLLNGTENMHYVDAVPQYILDASHADILCFVGFELEVGWLPKVLSRSGNSKIQKGGPGYCDVGASISPMDVPKTAIDRSMGDVHPFGNPHYWMSPRRMIEASKGVTNILVSNDQGRAEYYLNRQTQVEKLIRELLNVSEKKLSEAGIKSGSFSFMEYHREFVYFFDDLGLRSVGEIEEKPGISPSAAQIAKAAIRAKASKIKLVLSSENAPKTVLARFEKLSGIKVLRLPVHIKQRGGPSTYPELIQFIVDEIIKSAKENSE